MKCWIVDDEKKIVDYLAHAIEWSRYGFHQIESFTSSKEVLFLLEKGNYPDLLLTDIKMPEVSGLDLAQKAEGVSKVVIISGYSDFTYAQKAIRYSVLDYLLKPVFAEDLEKLIVKISQSITIETLTKEIDCKKFYLSLLTGHLKEETQLLLCCQKLLNQGYLPKMFSFGEEALLNFTFRHREFGFVYQNQILDLSSGYVSSYLFEQLFDKKIECTEDYGKWVSHLVEKHQWEEMLVQLENTPIGSVENIFLRLEILYQLQKHVPNILVNLTIGQVLDLACERHLEEWLKKINLLSTGSPDISHSILALQHYIRDNLSQPLSLESLADRIHMHPVYLSKVFKEKTGENLSQFILEERLLKMEKLLLTTDLKIKTITELVGYQKPQNINDFFKKRFGVRPSDYRRQHQL